MTQEKIDQKGVEIWPFIRYGVPIAIFLFFIAMTEMKDVGQFIKFFLYDVIAVNLLGVVALATGIFTISFGSYMIISKKSVNPKRIVLPMFLLTALFLALGFGLAHKGLDDFADVGNYLTGNIKEEHVLIKEFRVEATHDGYLYRYTFEDGRTFYEIYRGKGFGSVKEGETYFIRYLPKTKKLLRIESLQ